MAQNYQQHFTRGGRRWSSPGCPAVCLIEERERKYSRVREKERQRERDGEREVKRTRNKTTRRAESKNTQQRNYKRILGLWDLEV
jgi:hypothetical protein